jgi:TetR/AcrR family transcriptional repressor of nem operon
MHLLARSQGVATLAAAFHDEKFIRQEVKQMCDWLDSCAAGAMLDTQEKRGVNAPAKR